jgi:hypothetical protein
MVASATVLLLSKDEEHRGYAERTIKFYNLSPFGEIDALSLAFDMGYFLGIEEEVQLTEPDKLSAGSSPWLEAFNDLLNEARLRIESTGYHWCEGNFALGKILTSMMTGNNRG